MVLSVQLTMMAMLDMPVYIWFSIWFSVQEEQEWMSA
jgi:hypothetical protein